MCMQISDPTESDKRLTCIRYGPTSYRLLMRLGSLKRFGDLRGLPENAVSNALAKRSLSAESLVLAMSAAILGHLPLLPIFTLLTSFKLVPRSRLLLCFANCLQILCFITLIAIPRYLDPGSQLTTSCTCRPFSLLAAGLIGLLH